MEPSPRAESDDQSTSPDAGGSRPLWQSRRVRIAVMFVLLAVIIGWLIKSQLPPVMSAWHRYSAVQHFEQNELDEALQACDRALAWRPDAPELYEMRADIRLERGELQQALDDSNKVLELNPDYPSGYARRGFVYQLLGQHEKAIADARKFKDWLTEKKHKGHNQVAYTLAVASQDAKVLQEALVEVETALKLLGRDPSEQLAEDAAARENDLEFGMYLDTRGYIYHRQGKHQDALADLDKAIAWVERVKQAALARAKDQPNVQKYAEKHLNRQIRIIYQHRALVREKLGHAEEAQADKDKAQELGYDPKRDGE